MKNNNIENLPEGWASTKLSDVTSKIGSGATPRGGSDAYVAQGVPLIRSMNIHFDGFHEDGLVFLTDKQAEALQNVEVVRNDVLLNITGASIGRVTTAPEKMAGARVNQHVSIIRPLPNGIEPEFLASYLASPSIQLRINSEEYGVTRQALTKTWIQNFELPVPPLAEQRRIVAKVEELLAEVNAARDRLAKVPAILKRFRQSVLAAACSGRLTEDWREGQRDLNTGFSVLELIEDDRTKRKCPHKKGKKSKELSDDELLELSVPSNWATAQCQDLCQPERSLTYGVIKLGDSVTNGVPTLRSSDVRHLFLEDPSNVKRISRKIADNYSRTYLQGGEIVVTVRGTLGGVAVVPEEMNGWNISREVAVIPLERKLNPWFFAYMIGSLPAQNWLTGVVRGVAYSGVNIEDLRRLLLPVPPIEEQSVVVGKVQSLLGLADEIEQQLLGAQSRTSSISQSILAKAFRGELVPTEAELAQAEGRGYETASVLLERIRAAREEQKLKKKPKERSTRNSAKKKR